jgi:hypothetical protein
MRSVHNFPVVPSIVDLTKVLNKKHILKNLQEFNNYAERHYAVCHIAQRWHLSRSNILIIIETIYMIIIIH